MHDYRAVFNLFGFLQCCDEGSWIVTVNVADVFEAELTYERAGKYGRCDHILHGLRGMMQPLAKRRNGQQLLFHFIFEPVIAVRPSNAIQVTSQRPDGWGD